MTPPPKVDELTDEEAGRKYKERARTNRLKQQEFRRKMKAEGKHRISVYVTGESKAVMDRLAVTMGMNTGDVITNAILHYDKCTQSDSGNDTETTADFWRNEYDKVAAELRDYRGVIFGDTATDEEKGDSVSDNQAEKLTSVSDNQEKKADPLEIVERVTALDAELKSRKEVAARLNAEGFRTARGGEWSAARLSAFLQRQKERGAE